MTEQQQRLDFWAQCTPLLRKLAAEGVTAPKIAMRLFEETGTPISSRSVREKAQRLGIKLVSTISESPWDGKTEQLKEMWEQGVSASQIGAKLGLSRSAIIAKVHRLGLPRRMWVTPAIKPQLAPQRPLSNVKPATKALPKPAAKPVSQVKSDDTDFPVESGHGESDTTETRTSKNCSIMELDSQHCRWPIGKPGTPDFCYCGETPVRGNVYCAKHHRMAYNL